MFTTRLKKMDASKHRIFVSKSSYVSTVVPQKNIPCFDAHTEWPNIFFC